MRPYRLAVTLLLLCSGLHAQRLFSPKIRKGGRKLCSIQVLPAQFTITKFGFKGAQGLWEESDEFEDELTALVVKMLSHHSAKVTPTPLTTELSPDQRTALASIQRNYDGVDAQMKRSFGGVAKGRYTLGDVVAGYPTSASADTLVFIRGAGRMPASAKSVFVQRLTIQVRIGLVDARTGEVLAFFGFECEGSHSGSPTIAAAVAAHVSETLTEQPSLYGFLADGPKSACDR